MKKIHFGNLERKIGLVVIIGSIIGLLLIINGAFKFVQFENRTMSKYLYATGFILIAIFSTRMFWYKNYVQWSKNGILIRIKSFFGKNIKFKEIKSSELIDKKLIISETYGNKIEVDLSHIIESDIEKLMDIINKNTISNNVYV